MSSRFKLLIKNAKQVVRVRTNGERKVVGLKEMQDVCVLEANTESGVSILVDREGKIAYCGLEKEMNNLFPNVDERTDKIIDATGNSVIPGFVDAHTHPVWAGDRVHEFALKLAGADYMTIHEAGGGIHYTVDHTRNATEEALFQDLTKRLQVMRKTGTTFVECKSGYGLDLNTEVKMLRVIERARKEINIGISSTYLGAHAVPRNSTAEAATKDIIDQQIPGLKSLMDAGDLIVDNIDVFCEHGVFDVEQSRAILQAGRAAGMIINFHADEIHPLNGAKMGAEIGALAMSHLEEISEEGIRAMAQSGSVGVVLPTTAYILRLRPPPVRKMIEADVCVALGSDFNPNAYCMSMPMVMHLACVLMKMTMTEALIAATLNSAAALVCSDRHGSIEMGKYADLVILDADKWENIIYQFGCHNSLIKYVIVKGDVTFSREAGQ